jgi:hypothetical protein
MVACDDSLRIAVGRGHVAVIDSGPKSLPYALGALGVLPNNNSPGLGE